VAWRRQARWRPTDDALELGHGPRLARALEAARTVRLELVRGPDPLHGAQGRSGGLGHRPARPGRSGASPRPGGRCRRPPAQVGATTRRTTVPAGQRQTAGRLIPARRATVAASSRSAERRIIRARAACSCGRSRSATVVAKRARPSAETRGQAVSAIPKAWHGAAAP
jgi:hypothetical protein